MGALLKTLAKTENQRFVYRVTTLKTTVNQEIISTFNGHLIANIKETENLGFVSVANKIENC